MINKKKPFLALTALVLFGYVAIATQEVCIRHMSLVVIVNAFLCHMGGFIMWDIFCNVILIVLVLSTACNRRTIWSIAFVGVVAWVLNHCLFDNCVLHALLVQGGGALALKILRMV
jgi:predicted membrane-bound dolichyl-phosphate-mannose-protein mannosyltransferase